MYCNYKLSRDIFRFLKMDARNKDILRKRRDKKFIKKYKIIKYKKYFNFEKIINVYKY